MSVQIDKGIPMPSGRGRSADYPWDEMEVGDSFVPRARTGSRQLVNSANSAKHRVGKEFAARTVDGCPRIWRIK